RGRQVVGMLPREVREIAGGADAGFAVAGLARLGFLAAHFRIARGGECGCGEKQAGEDGSACGQGGLHFCAAVVVACWAAQYAAMSSMSLSLRCAAIARIVAKSRSPLLYAFSAVTRYAAFWPVSLGTEYTSGNAVFQSFTPWHPTHWKTFFE